LERILDAVAELKAVELIGGRAAIVYALSR
jgi:hypothetical protein